MSASRPLVLVEDDPWTRLIQVVLDPDTPAERVAAFADFMSPDEPDFAGWCADVRARAGRLWPARVRMVETREELLSALPEADAVITESLPINAESLAVAPRLKAVQKYGAILRNIDTAACAARGVAVLPLRRRANIACAEHAFAMLLMLVRRLQTIAGLISPPQLQGAGFPYRPFDRRHTPNGNWGRIGGTRSLYGSTIGIIGMGEIGREIAVRAAAFEMAILYHQRTRLSAAEEQVLHASYAELDELLAQSDWVVPQLPSGPSTRHLIDSAKLAQMKPGAFLINVSRADVVDRAALIAALHSGHLGGFALDPLYEEPGNADDELLAFQNVLLIPHMAGSPRHNGLRDIEELVVHLSKEIN